MALPAAVVVATTATVASFPHPCAAARRGRVEKKLDALLRFNQMMNPDAGNRPGTRPGGRRSVVDGDVRLDSRMSVDAGKSSGGGRAKAGKVSKAGGGSYSTNGSFDVPSLETFDGDKRERAVSDAGDKLLARIRKQRANLIKKRGESFMRGGGGGGHRLTIPRTPHSKLS